MPYELLVFCSLALGVSACAAVYDLKTGAIPNWLTLGPLALGILSSFTLHLVQAGWREGLLAGGYALGGAMLSGLVPLLLYRSNGIGGGDVKLFAAIGALCPLRVAIEAQFSSFVLAALFITAKMAWEGRLLRVLGSTGMLALNPFLPKSKRRVAAPAMLVWLRFAPFVFVGLLISLYCLEKSV